MAPPRINFPSDAELLKAAKKLAKVDPKPSRTKLALLFEIKPETFNGRLRKEREDVMGQIDALFTPSAGSSEPAAIDDPQRVKIDQLEADNAALKKENKTYAAEMATREQFLEQVAETVLRPVKARKLKVKPRPKRLPRRTAITPIYDVQYGQEVRAEDTPGGRGAYSTAIFDQHLQRWYEGVTGLLRDYADSHNIIELIVPLGGDLVEGHDVFKGQEWHLELDPFTQTWQLCCKLGGDKESDIPGVFPELITFAKEDIGVKRVRFYVVPGNHGKPGGRQAGALHSTHSFDWLSGMILRDKLLGLVDDFAIEPGGALYFGAAGHTFLMIHGDEIRGWGGIPFYGIQRYDGKAVRQGHILHDYLLMGDKHVPAELEQGGGGETLMQPAWVGDNNLSRQLGAAARPGQRVYFVAEKWGITETARIRFEPAAEAREPSKVHA